MVMMKKATWQNDFATISLATWEVSWEGRRLYDIGVGVGLKRDQR